MKQLLLFFLSLLSCVPITAEVNKDQATTNFTLSGYVTDAASQETLIGATVYNQADGQGTSTNEYGFYSLTLPEGQYTLQFSFVGYATQEIPIQLYSDTTLSPNLSSGELIRTFEVESEDAYEDRHLQSSMSTDRIDLKTIDKLPLLMGETDVISVIQLKPGVQTGSEGSSGPSVRGGGADQNLMLLDGVPIYNANHLFGFLSTFNSDALKSAKILKGGFPARYGGRLSSIIDVRMKEGDMREYHGNISLGLMSGKFNFEGPIIKDKTSFIISGRRTWIDQFTTPIQKSAYKKSDNSSYWAYHFYDLNAKINHKFSDRNRLFLSAFLGDDQLSEDAKYGLLPFPFPSDTMNTNAQATPIIEEKNKIIFGNRLLSLRWNYQLGSKLFSNTTLTYSKYRYNYTGTSDSDLNETDVAKKEFEKFSSNSDIKDLGAKWDLSYIPNPKHYIRLGAGYTRHQFTPTTNTLNFSGPEVTDTTLVSGDSKIKADEISAYLEDDIKLGKRLSLNAGVHFSSFAVEDSNYLFFQPRVALSCMIKNDMSIKASYSQMAQNIHLLVSTRVGLPTDLWVPSTNKITPSTAQQYSLGLTKSFGDQFEFTVESYFKKMQNVVEYKSGENIFSSSEGWEKTVDVGKGTSYGFEFLLEKKLGKTTGWLGYTYSKTTRQFENINFGAEYPYKYDRRHDINFVAMHQLNERIDFGLIWVLGTGNAYSLAGEKYRSIDGEIVEVAERNNQRLGAYHRLDISANFTKQKIRGKRVWSVGIYNAYNHQNPFYLTKRQEGARIKLVQQSLLPVLPFVTWKRQF